MGRKIPGKKHRGVKDPEKQRSKRLNSLKGKINISPSDPDVQEIPRSVNRIAKLKEQLKNESNKKRNKVMSLHKQESKKKKNMQFRQRKGESDKEFLFRVQKACNTIIQETAFQNKYHVDIKRNPETGEVERLAKRPKDELEELCKKTKKEAKSRKGKKRNAETSEPHLTKSQKRQRKLTERKQKKALKEDFKLENDVVKFGEVAHAPPTLSVPKKVAKLNSAPRPGQKDLLLKLIIQDKKDCLLKSIKKDFIKSEDKLRQTSNKVINKTGKRKHLPNALRRRLEKQQAEIINAYRLLKKQKNTAIAV